MAMLAQLNKREGYQFVKIAQKKTSKDVDIVGGVGVKTILLEIVGRGQIPRENRGVYRNSGTVSRPQ